MVLFAPLARLVLTRFRWFFATGDQRDAEILALRHQILVLIDVTGQGWEGFPTQTDRDCSRGHT